MYHKNITISTNTKYLHHLVMGTISDSLGYVMDSCMTYEIDPYEVKRELKTIRDYLYLVGELCEMNDGFKMEWYDWLCNLRGLVSQLDDSQVEYVTNMVVYVFEDYDNRRF